jgi:hypothetical protein
MGRRNGSNHKPTSRKDFVSLQEKEEFEKAWTENMKAYWVERLDRLRVFDTGNLRSQIEGTLLLQGAKTVIQHSFPAYGKYADDGTGREFTNTGYTDSLGRHYTSSRESEGTLPFLLPGGEEYRKNHGLDRPKKVGPAWGGRVAGGHPRQPKPWYWTKYYASRMVLNEMEQEYFGNEYMGMFTTALDEVLGQTRMMM